MVLASVGTKCTWTRGPSVHLRHCVGWARRHMGLFGHGLGMPWAWAGIECGGSVPTLLHWSHGGALCFLRPDYTLDCLPRRVLPGR